MLTFQNIIDLNIIMNEVNVPIKIHLSDACGGSRMWIEELDGFSDEIIPKYIELITEYFKSKYENIKFSEDKKSFWTI